MNLNSPVTPPPVNWHRILTVTTWVMVGCVILSLISRLRTLIVVSELAAAILVPVIVVAFIVLEVIKANQNKK